MTTNENPAAVRVCAIADIECSRGCGTGACKREQPAAAPIDASPNDIPEGCTPADAQMLREANHALAAENDSLRRALRPFARIVSVDKLSWAMVEYCVEGDPEKQTFQSPQMQRAFNRAADMLRNEFATQAASGEIDDVQVSRDGFSGGNPAVDSPARDFRLSSEPADERAAFEAALDKRAKSAGFEVGRMTECELDNAWWGWQAARAASANEMGAEGGAPAQAAEPVAIPERKSGVWPTNDMNRAGLKALAEFHHSRGDTVDAVFLAMSAAAPQPPAQADARVGLTDVQRRAISSGIAALERNGWTDPVRVLRALLQGANHAE